VPGWIWAIIGGAVFLVLILLAVAIF